MLKEMFNLRPSNFAKRSLISWKFGTNEDHNTIHGNDNKVEIHNGVSKQGQETLVRKAGHEIGRVLEGGTDILTAPAKWLNHMQENWWVPLHFSSLIDLLMKPSF